MQNVNIFLVDIDAGNLKAVEDFFQPICAEIFFTSDLAVAQEQLETLDPKLVFISLECARAESWLMLKPFNEKLIPIIGLVEHEQSKWIAKGPTSTTPAVSYS